MQLNSHPFATFREAAQQTLEFLHARLGFDLWMITRVEDNDWLILETEDHGYHIGKDRVFNWKDSYCYRMVNGDGPHIAPVARAVPAYADAAVNKLASIGSYIGFPLMRADGTLYGTLCAIDPAVQPSSITAEFPLIEMCARFLSTLLDQDARSTDLMRHLEQMEARAMRDPLTLLYNRNGWETLAAAEFARCRRHGFVSSVIAIDLDGLKNVNDRRGHAAGDELLQKAAQVLLESTRSSDITARLGGDEFAILCVDCALEDTLNFVARLHTAFEDAAVDASIGWAPFTYQSSLREVCEAADAGMYLNKATRKATAAHSAAAR